MCHYIQRIPCIYPTSQSYHKTVSNCPSPTFVTQTKHLVYPHNPLEPNPLATSPSNPCPLYHVHKTKLAKCQTVQQIRGIKCMPIPHTLQQFLRNMCRQNELSITNLVPHQMVVDVGFAVRPVALFPVRGLVRAAAVVNRVASQNLRRESQSVLGQDGFQQFSIGYIFVGVKRLGIRVFDLPLVIFMKI